MGLFRRFNHMQEASLPFSIFLYTMLCLAFLFGLADSIYTLSLASALSAFMTALLLSMPISAIFAFFYPLCRANRVLAYRNCALVGEEAVQELGERKTVIFPDTQLYSAEKCTEISIREGDDLRTNLRLAGYLFAKLGGTLHHIGQPLPKSAHEDPQISIIRIQNAGVEAIVDNHHMLAGSAEFLARHGVRAPKESADKALRRGNTVGLMYVAIDSIVRLSYEIEYKTDDRFERVIRELADSHATVAVRTYDPNLNEAFLERSRDASLDPIRVIKPGRFEEEGILEMTDTCAIALGSKTTDIAYPIHAAQKIHGVRRFAMRMQVIASIIGVGAAVALTVLHQQEMLGILSIAAYQCFWVLVTLIASRSELSAIRLHFRREKNKKG